MENVDKTIDAICTWIQGELNQVVAIEQPMMLSEMTKALAELVSARANADVLVHMRSNGSTIRKRQ